MLRNLRWLSDAPQQITRTCKAAGLRSALRLAAAILMVSGCGMVGSGMAGSATVDPAVDPALSALVSSDVNAQSAFAGIADRGAQPSLDSVDSHPIAVHISLIPAEEASREAEEQRVRRDRQARRERLARRDRQARHERLARQGRVVKVQAAAPAQVSPMPKTLPASAISKTTDAETQTRLASQLADATANAVNAPEMTTVDSLFFSANQAALVVPSAPLDAVVALLEANPTGVIVLEGHADTNEFAATTLSWRRAEGARDYLLKRGVPGYRVRIRSQGASSPSPIDAREVGAQNRRVALLLQTDKP